jgi:hypothetical protein
MIAATERRSLPRFDVTLGVRLRTSSLTGFKTLVPGTPDTAFVWVFAGTLTVVISGKYRLCDRSDDGSNPYINLYINDEKVIDNEWNHSFNVKCVEKDQCT